jgi:SAM-dependent methyltransferase
MSAPLLNQAIRARPQPAAPRPADRLLDTSNARGLGIWHDVLTLQVDLFVRAEIAAFRRSAAWRAAGSVLEAGCGNGRYLAALSRAFPGKRYLGIDRSEGLIELAGAYRSARRRFQVVDFLDGAGAGSFDAVIMRFVVQHLSDLGALLDRTAAYLRPGGSLFVIEPDVSNSANTPATPKFDAMLAEFARVAAGRGRLRVQLAQLPALIGEIPGWEAVRDEAISVESRGPFAGTDLLRLYRSWTDLCEQQGSFAPSFDFTAVRGELDGWASRPVSRSHIGLRMLEVRRSSEVGVQH